MTKIIKIDKLDRKILYYLDVNARMSTLQIAKKLKTSREVVDYRIKRLIKNEVIRRFYSHIQSQKMGYTIYKLYFKIKGLNEEKEKELVDYFIHHPYVYRVVSGDGIYDLIVSITSKDVYKLSEMLHELFHRYDANFLSRDMTISVAIYHCRREYLIGKPKKELGPLFKGGEKGSMILDDKDIEILKILANNARIPIIEIAKEIGITSGAVIYRIKQLEKKEIISAYRCAINLEKIGFILCKVYLSLHFTDPKKERELHQFCLQHPQISFFLYAMGRWNFELELEIEDTVAFHNLLREIKIRFSDIIKDCETVIISQEHKFDNFPECYPSRL